MKLQTTGCPAGEKLGRMQQHEDNPMERTDVVWHLATFVDTNFVHHALVSRVWRGSWGTRPKTTKAVTTFTTCEQLFVCFLLGLLSTFKVVNAAAILDRIDLVDTAVNHGCPVGYSTWTSAAAAGSIGVLQWLHYNTRIGRGNPYICAFAAKGGSLECLQFLRSVGFAWNVSTAAYAAQGGFGDVLHWALEIKCTTCKRGLSQIMFHAGLGGHVDTLAWVVEYFQYDVQMNCPIVYGGIAGGKISALNYVLSVSRLGNDRRLWNSSVWREAACNGRMEVLEWGWANALRSDYPERADNTVTSSAVLGRKLDALRWLVQKGFRVDINCWVVATRSGNQAIMDYLRSIECPGSV